MLEADTLASLADDLRALSYRGRSTVLAVLSSYERAQVAALIDATAVPGPVKAAVADYNHFSPWLARHLGADADGSVHRNLTAATRRVLVEAAADLGQVPVRQVDEPAPRRRSLAEAFGQLLFARQALR